ncbi:MAG: phosphate acetyltransferase [gamma proteobacterium symbiont of Bathyaustriella thionipta]|nr:phosphate acetyltransferase [gamma proteobacterium symbiont of Bathyaustriella thionipta]
MQHSLYLTTAEAHSGKAIVLLGLLEWLHRHSHNIGLFRPVIQQSPQQDRFIQLAMSRYELPHSPESAYGYRLQEAMQLISEDNSKQLQEGILQRYKALESQCDSVICVGTDFGFASPALELDFNIEVSRHLGAQVILVSNGLGRSMHDNIEIIQTLLRAIHKRGGSLLGGFINRVDPDLLQNLKQQLQTLNSPASHWFCLPEEATLEHPTLSDLVRTLGARRILGQDEDLHREIRGIKVAAMQIPNYLEHIHEGDLIITPGDRADILLGSIAAYRSSHYAQISGLLLSGDLSPAASVQKLLNGLQEIPLPILQVASDTFDTAMAVGRIQPELCADNPRKLAAALGLMETHTDLQSMLAPLQMQNTRRVTPLMFEYELLQRARSDKQHIVLPESSDDRILRAAEILLLREVVQITLLGDPAQVATRSAELGLNLQAAKIVDPLTSPWRKEFADIYYDLRKHKGISQQMAFDAMADVSYFATMMIQQGYADGMVSGAAHTTQHTIRPAFEIIRTRAGASLVSSVFFMCLPDKVLVYGDCAINPEPNAGQLADIAIASADTAAAFGVEPRVALLSYSTGTSGKGEEVDKVREATRIAQSLRPQLALDGPVQYDAAVDPGVAASKLPDSSVAGRATVLIFPDLNTGNNTYKAVQRSSGAVAIGPVLQGLNKPVNDLSRGCTVTDIINTVAITAIQAQQNGTQE